MIKFFFQLILLPAILILCLDVAHAAETSQQYSQSISAIRQNVSSWLNQNDHSYRVIPESGGIIRFRGSTHNDQWVIELRPRSPLATTVFVHLDGNDEKETNIKELLHYLELRDTTIAPISEQQPEIPAAVLEQISTVACIRAERQEQTVQFSGVFIDNQGLILSTAHDLKEQEEVSIISTINTLFKGEIIKIDFERDLALIRIKTDKEHVIDLEEARNLISMGEKVFSIGCPIGLRGTVNSGYINGPPRLTNNLPMWQASIEIQPGSSGSPVFDSNGNFVALVKGRHRVSEGIGFLIPLEVIIDFLNEQLKQ